MVLSLLAVSRGWFLSRTSPARIRRGYRWGPGKALALNQHRPCGRRSARLICCGDHGRPLSAPLTEDVARKARRADGSPSDYDPKHLSERPTRIPWSAGGVRPRGRDLDRGHAHRGALL